MRQDPAEPPRARADCAHRHAEGKGAGGRACGADVQRCAARAAYDGWAGMARAFAIRHLSARFQSAICGRPGSGGGGGEPRHRGAGAALDRGALRSVAGGDRHGAGHGAGRAGYPRRAGLHQDPRRVAQHRRLHPARNRKRGRRLPGIRLYCRARISDAPAAAHAARAAHHHLLAGSQRPAGDPHQQPGAVPHTAAGCHDPADSGEPHSCDQAAHRRRVRRQAGNAPGRHLRRADAGLAPAGEDGVHARRRVLYGAQPASADSAPEDGCEGGRHAAGEPDDGPGHHRRLRKPREHGAGQHGQQGAAALSHAAHALRGPRGLHQYAGGGSVPRLWMPAGILRAGIAGG